MIHRLKDRKGQAIVEMALVSLLFFFLFFSVIEFARALYSYNTIVHFARAAARFAVVNNVDAGGLDRVRNVAVYGNPDSTSGGPVLPGLTTAMVNVAVQNLDLDAYGNPMNRKISVIISGYQFDFAVPIPSITLPSFETSLYTESLGVVPQ